MHKFNSEKHNRQSTRLRGYDYSKKGKYFVTLNCYDKRIHLFGKVKNGKMFLNKYGEIVAKEWANTPIIRSNISLGASVVMPNHIHGILIIDYQISLTKTMISPTHSLGAIIRGYKGAVTKQINLERGYKGPVWQRNYHDHIIRNKQSFDRISSYVKFNPLNWTDDCFYTEDIQKKEE